MFGQIKYQSENEQYYDIKREKRHHIWCAKR